MKILAALLLVIFVAYLVIGRRTLIVVDRHGAAKRRRQ